MSCSSVSTSVADQTIPPTSCSIASDREEAIQMDGFGDSIVDNQASDAGNGKILQFLFLCFSDGHFLHFWYDKFQLVYLNR